MNDWLTRVDATHWVWHTSMGETHEFEAPNLASATTFLEKELGRTIVPVPTGHHNEWVTL